MAKKKTSPAPLAVLPPFTQEEYQETFSNAVHFSFKAVNTNASEGGVRLSPDQVLDLPYISAQTLQSQGTAIECDYSKQEKSPPSATVFKHYRLSKGVDDKESVANAHEIQITYRDATQSHFEKNTHIVSPRLKQIFLPLNEGHEDYQVTTPLPAAGVSKLINEHVSQTNKDIRLAVDAPDDTLSLNNKIARNIRRAEMGYGGSNPQNAGSLVRYMQSPLFFSAPTESAAVKTAFSLYYTGMPISLNKAAMEAYKDWRTTTLLKHGYALSRKADRDTEEGHLTSITNALLRRAKLNENVLLDNAACLPNEGMPLVNDALDTVQKGLLDHRCRDRVWAKEAANIMAWAIATFTFHDDSTLGFNESAVNAIASYIEGVLV